MDTPQFYRFALGEHEGWVISDGTFTAGTERLAVDGPADQVNALLDAAFLPRGPLSLHVLALLLHWGKEWILIDTGCGKNYGDTLGFLPARLDQLGLSPEEITAIVFTHLHLDHIGGAIDLDRKQLRFPCARLLVAHEELAFWSQPVPDLSRARGDPARIAGVVKGVHAHLAIFGDRFEVFKPGDAIFEGITATPLPGHTPGHCGFELAAADQRFWHIGDALVEPVFNVPHPEWLAEGDSEPGVNLATRRLLLERAARERLKLFGCHFPYPGFGYVRQDRDGKREFIPARW